MKSCSEMIFVSKSCSEMLFVSKSCSEMIFVSPIVHLQKIPYFRRLDVDGLNMWEKEKFQLPSIFSLHHCFLQPK